MTDRALAVSADAFAFTEEIARIREPNEVVRRVHSLVGGFGFHVITFGRVPGPGQRLEDFVLAKHATNEWFEVYVGRRYYEFDPVFLRLPNIVMPYQYRVDDYPDDEPRMKELNAGRRDFRLTRGFMVPVHQGSRSGFVWMSGEVPNLSLRTKAALHLTALYAFARIKALLNPAPVRSRGLTAREREVLTWIAAGKSSWEIGEILGIAKRTVDEHVRSAARKLGAVNRTQAVAVALRERLITV